MNGFNYTPDSVISVHKEAAIRLICQAFLSHENGLPEWLKNSADAYVREDFSPNKRVIILTFNCGKATDKASIGCLDFCGMTSEVIENRFRIWADPDAAKAAGGSDEVQGGYGNGGKCYMTQMFNNYSFIYTIRNGLSCHYGVPAHEINFGYIPNRQEGKDFLVENIKKNLNNIVRSVGCSVKDIERVAPEVIEQLQGFTFVRGVNPKDYGNRIPYRKLIENLQQHHQMVRTLELCKIYVFVNGKLYNNSCLTVPPITPIEGAGEPRIITIPDKLQDPISEKGISTTKNQIYPEGRLILQTSQKSMKWGLKGRHIVSVKTRSGYIGRFPVSELDIQSPFRDKIYGRCELEALEDYKKNERAALSDSLLTRAVKNFVAAQIEAYAKVFEVKERFIRNQEEKNAIGRINEALDSWKNRFLSKYLASLWGGRGGGRVVRETLPKGKPERIELVMTYNRAGIGVAFRPTLKFYDKDDRQIRSTPFRWVSEDDNVAMVDEDLIIINTFSPGETQIWAETLDGKLSSNKTPLEVVRIINISLVPDKVELTAGSRGKIEAICELDSGDKTSGVCLEWIVDNNSIANVSSSGFVYGFTPGKTQVTAGDDRSQANNVTEITVTEAEKHGPGEKSGGSGYPKVLMSNGYNRDPFTDEDVNLSSEDPPVYQRPQDADHNIWWINSNAPLAKFYLDKSKGFGYESSEFRVYLLERYIEIIVQIAMKNNPEEKESKSVDEWLFDWGYKMAEIQTAAASELGSFVIEGTLPEEIT